MKWFKHDSNANRDVKLKRLIMRHGLAGYGLYFYCLERITDRIEQNNLTFRLEDDAEILAHDLRMHVDEINSMMRYMVELELFEESQGFITCYKLAKRLDQSMTSNPEMRKIINGVRKNHDSLMIESGQNHDSDMTESEQIRLDKIRKEKNKQKRKTDKKTIPPSIDMVAEYCAERQNGIDPQHFMDYYDTVDWMRGKNRIKDWSACVRYWERNQRSKPNGSDDLDLEGAL